MGKTKDDILSAIAVVKGKVLDTERKYYQALFTKKIYRVISQDQIDEESMGALYHKYPEYFGSIQDFTKCVIDATHRVFGDPRMQHQHQEQLKQYAVAYWNPTNHRINIHSLGIYKHRSNITGLPKDPPDLVDFVEPGEQVMIPKAYTLGGKYSSIAGVAPQLVRLPNSEIDDLEISPTSYTEWCTFGSGKTFSKCCKQPILWGETCASLVCQKCGERCFGL